MIEKLEEALGLDWEESLLAGRILRHTEILRGLAHELSTAPDRQDLPASAEEARTRWRTHLDELARTPRKGLAASTGAFIDTLIERASRYEDHLFHCFDDPRIPANTNALEGFFGMSKRTLRHAVGCGSTTNSVVANLGAEPLLALHHLGRGGKLKVAPARSPAEFTAARREVAEAERDGIHRRSVVRHLDRHIERLRKGWLDQISAEGNA